MGHINLCIMLSVRNINSQLNLLPIRQYEIASRESQGNGL